MKLPLAVILGFMPLVGRGAALVQSNGIGGLAGLSKAIIPYDFNTRRFDASELSLGLYPILAGVMVHKVAGMLGVNKALAAAKVPFIRV